MRENYVATCFDLDLMSWRFEKMPRKGRGMTQALGAPNSSKPFSVSALGAFSFETVRLVCVMAGMMG